MRKRRGGREAAKKKNGGKGGKQRQKRKMKKGDERDCDLGTSKESPEHSPGDDAMGSAAEGRQISEGKERERGRKSGVERGKRRKGESEGKGDK